MTSPPIELAVGGKRYRGWQTVEITRSIEALSGSFTIGLSEQWAGQPEPWPIADDAECSVLIDGVPVITGFIYKTDLGFDTNSRTVTVRGRDRTGDVVDASAQLGSWSFSNVNVLELAKKICAPYRVPVMMQPGLVAQTISVPKKHSIDPGDTAGEALTNLLKVAGLLAVADGSGGLVLTRAGRERVATVLVEGQNMKVGRASFDTSHRFRDYQVLGSHKGSSKAKGTAKDLGGRAGRTLIIRPDNGVTPALAKQRAEWEASVRAARGESMTVQVQGWAESAFEPAWPINKLVRVKSPSCRVDGDALIAGVTLRHNDTEGTTTTLDLRNPAAFTPDPTIAKPGSGNNYWREIVKGV